MQGSCAQPACSVTSACMRKRGAVAAASLSSRTSTQRAVQWPLSMRSLEASMTAMLSTSTLALWISCASGRSTGPPWDWGASACAGEQSGRGGDSSASAPGARCRARRSSSAPQSRRPASRLPSFRPHGSWPSLSPRQSAARQPPQPGAPAAPPRGRRGQQELRPGAWLPGGGEAAAQLGVGTCKGLSGCRVPHSAIDR